MAEGDGEQGADFSVRLEVVTDTPDEELIFDFTDEFSAEETVENTVDNSTDAVDEAEHPSSQPNSQEMAEMIKQATSANTQRSTSWGLKKFTDWTFKRKRNIDLKTIDAEQLNSELRKFYADVKGNDGKALTPSALTGIRSALHRTIISPPNSRSLNIIADREFITSNQMFTTRCKLYYKCGHSKPKHKPAIGSGDMMKLREYFKNYNQNPTILVEYIWFVLCFYFGRRGREGWREFSATSFEVKVDDKAREYVCFTETEITKNHQGGHLQSQQDYSDQRMYETLTDLDPVAAYKFYMDKRHSDCPAFFQTPLMHYSQDQKCWYKKAPIGKNTLSHMMQNI